MIVFVMENYIADGNEVHSVWSCLEQALDALKAQPDTGAWSAFSALDAYELNDGGGEDSYAKMIKKYPTIFYRKEVGRFYTHFGDEAWYFDSAVEYRMKAVGALRDG